MTGAIINTNYALIGGLVPLKDAIIIEGSDSPYDDISLAPLTITIEGKVHKDRIDIKPDEFYNIIEELDKEPTTAMPSPSEYLKIINQAVQDGYTEILCICMSSGTSAAYQSAVLAKDYFFEENPNSTIKIYIVDSKSMSHGSGWLILKVLY